MTNDDSQKRSCSRRKFIKVTAVGAAMLAGRPTSVAEENSAKSKQNLIQLENRKEGARDWQLTRVRLDEREGFRSSDIEGYCSKQSVAAGRRY